MSGPEKQQEQEVDIFAELGAPFLEADLDWLVIQSGLKNDEPWAIVAPYVDARAIMDRLDRIVGSENWQDTYIHTGKGVLCKLGIRVSGEWIWKEDGSEETEIEGFKGGLSKALVRAAVKWRIGRYLYSLPLLWADFAQVEKKTPGALPVSIKKKKEDKYGETYYFVPPKLPAWALPKERAEQKKEERKLKAAETPPAPKEVKRTAEDVQKEITAACIGNKLRPTDLKAIVADRYGISNQKDLNLEQLEDLLSFLETEMK